MFPRNCANDNAPAFLQKRKAIVLFNREYEDEREREREREMEGRSRWQPATNTFIYDPAIVPLASVTRLQRNAPRPTQFSSGVRYVFINGTHPEYRRRAEHAEFVMSMLADPVPRYLPRPFRRLLSHTQDPPKPSSSNIRYARDFVAFTCSHPLSNVTSAERRTLRLV